MKWLILSISCFSIGLFSNPKESNHKTIVQTSLSETLCQSAYSNNVSIKEVKQHGRLYGYSIWMNTDYRCKVKYFAQRSDYQSVYQKYNTWKTSYNIIAFTSAAYTLSDYRTSKGLTVEEGQIINNSLDKEMDGIVLVYKNNIYIFSSQESFYFKELNQNINLKSNYSKQIFLNWIRKNRATLFQTHLLALNDELKITSSGRKKPARRKVLAKITQNGQEYNIIFYIKKGEYLYNAAKNIQKLLQGYGNVTIKGMINLDTGLNDVLHVKKPLANCNNRTIKGREESSLATNILSFYYE